MAKVYLQPNTVTIPDLGLLTASEAETAVGIPASNFTWTLGNCSYDPDANTATIEARHTFENGDLVNRSYIFICAESWEVGTAYDALLSLPQYSGSELQS